MTRKQNILKGLFPSANRSAQRHSVNRSAAIIVLVILFSSVATYLLMQSHAATPTANVEPELGTVVSPATKVTDGTASGGQAIKFNTSSPSGEPMPVGNLTGWTQTYAEDFNKDAVAGLATNGFKAVYANSWCGYNEGTGGKYYNDEVLSAHNGVMDFTLNGVQGGAGGFRTSGTSCGQIYGRFSIRFKAVGAGSYGTAIMVWPNSNVWGDGEVDYPEGDFDNTFNANQHGVGCGQACGANVAQYFTHTTYTNWHTATTEWTSSGVKYYLDGTLLMTVAHDIPINSHRYMIQMAPTHTPAVSGHFLIDWVTAYAPS